MIRFAQKVVEKSVRVFTGYQTNPQTKTVIGIGILSNNKSVAHYTSL